MEVWADCSACSCTHPAIAWLPLWCGGHFQAKSTSFRSPAAARSCGNAAFIVRHVHPSLMPHGMSQYKLLHVRIRSPRSQRKIAHGSGASEALPTIAPLEGPRIFSASPHKSLFSGWLHLAVPSPLRRLPFTGPFANPRSFSWEPSWDRGRRVEQTRLWRKTPRRGGTGSSFYQSWVATQCL